MKTLFALAPCAPVLLLFACGGQPDIGSSAPSTGSSADSLSTSCWSSDDCDLGDYCATTSGESCGERGTCQTLPFVCPEICEPVCGCDGNTYDNSCHAQAAGTNPSFSGFCEENPGTGCWLGSAGGACSQATAQDDCNAHDVGKGYRAKGDDSLLYCDATSSTCAVIPAGCKTYGRVCGTDGKTYASECRAYWTGRVGVRSTGACPVGGETCSDASDCTGLLSKICEDCADGTTQCSHWDCDDNQCVRTLCQDNGGAASF